MRSLKSAKKTKMADDGRVSVNSKQTVLRIHDKIKKEVHEIASKKSWNAQQKEEFERKLLELYKESVEETIKENVTIGGQAWDNVGESEASSSSLLQEEVEPLNRDRITEVLQICSELDDMIRDTTQKRKKYPQQIVEGVGNILQSHKEFLENYQPMIKSNLLSGGSNVITPDLEECIQRLQGAASDVMQLSKSFPELHSKAERLQQAVHSRQAMQECETDGVLFALENKNETLNSSSTEPTVLQDDESTEKLKMVDFLWWGGERRRSRPPVRFDASQNTYGP
ncbi:unnamed protein product [Pocillopora meandrina]|uniref:Uncharacterized protein n=1 Tax=Pocillopora meandrina TaxID=46732 RepID=A0AAU9WWK5_9CNID|nr:unnamed protein product [Pocillopora meandrina]